jgi:hypothetical protein
MNFGLVKVDERGTNCARAAIYRRRVACVGSLVWPRSNINHTLRTNIREQIRRRLIARSCYHVASNLGGLGGLAYGV